MPVKRYDLLVEAFAKVVAVHPEWRLRIYGQGPERANLRAAIDTLGLNDHVFLMGPHATMETEWAKASIAAVSSEWESFGMTILEAMHAGVPVVATDCPHGPGEIITDGSDGLLVPSGDPDALAAGLLKLIEDPDQMRRLGAAARSTVQRFAPSSIALQYEQLIGELLEARTPVTLKITRRARRAIGALLPRASRVPRTNETPGPGPKNATSSSTGELARDAKQRPLRPMSDCRVDTEGSVRISVRASGVSGEGLALVLRRRHNDDELRIPLESPSDTNDPRTLTLTRDRLSLAEGRWDLHIERSEDGIRRRLKAGLVEQRGLLSATPAAGEPVTWSIPYTTKDGYLALRTFHRAAHGEVTALPAGDGSLTVEAFVHGVVLGEGAALVGVSRGEGTEGFETPVTAVDGRLFRARLMSLPSRVGPDKALWDLFLRPVQGAEPVRLGRLLGDIVDRKETDKYPAVTMATSTGGSVAARFFFTVTNDLAISAS